MESAWPLTIKLDGMYPEGVLREGQEVQRSDDFVVCEPHRVTMSELTTHVGGTPERIRLLEHLTAFHDLFAEVTRNDPRAELWARGNLVSTLTMEADEIDLVAFYGEGLSVGHGWLLGQLLASRVALPPYSLVVTALRHDNPEHEFDRAREARRSRVRARDHNNNAVEAGWLSLTLGGESR